MLESLYIKNYRLFKELKINSLKRVNLIVGKNNVGKTSVLESIFTYVGKDDIPSIIYGRLVHRGEWNKNTKGIQNILTILKALFPNRNPLYSSKKNDYILIGESEKKHVKIFIKDNEPNLKNKFKPHLVVEFKDINNKSDTILIDMPIIEFEDYQTFYTIDNIKYITASPMLNRPNFTANLWERIVFTEKEVFVIDTLKIIESNIERIAFIDEGFDSKNKKAIIKLKNNDEPVSLASLGGGINHILKIILALVYCENGYFLIDEFETGLHWSVQADLWRVIFHLAEKLNIQVFATTHSRDTIRALEEVAQAENQEANTQFIKLVNKNGDIHAIEYDFENVAIAIEDNLEIR